MLKAEPTAVPIVAPMAALRRKPVMRLMSVATAMEPVERTTSESVALRPGRGAGAAVPACRRPVVDVSDVSPTAFIPLVTAAGARVRRDRSSTG